MVPRTVRSTYTMSSSILIDIDVIVPSDEGHSEAGSQANLDGDHLCHTPGLPGARSRPPQAHAVPRRESQALVVFCPVL